MITGSIVGLKISSIIFSTMFFYSLYRSLGYEKQFKREISIDEKEKIKVLQLALLVYFGGFMETVSGFGVPAAVIGPLILSTGLGSFNAVLYSLLGHGWAVPFASLGVPTIALYEIAPTDIVPLVTYSQFLISISLTISAIYIGFKVNIPLRKLIVILLPSLTIIYTLMFSASLATPLLVGLISFI
ncbi:MAG: hypothetical protein DRN95_04420, partial [Candidatus Hydrothermarchaeota archaeon]